MIKFWIRQILKTMCWPVTLPVAAVGLVAFLFVVFITWLNSRETFRQRWVGEWSSLWPSIKDLLIAREIKNESSL